MFLIKKALFASVYFIVLIATILINTATDISTESYIYINSINSTLIQIFSFIGFVLLILGILLVIVGLYRKNSRHMLPTSMKLLSWSNVFISLSIAIYCILYYQDLQSHKLMIAMNLAIVTFIASFIAYRFGLIKDPNDLFKKLTQRNKL